MRLAKRMNLFPTPAELKALEDKYGDFVSDADVEGGRVAQRNGRPAPPDWKPYSPLLIDKTLPQLALKQYAAFESKFREGAHRTEDHIDEGTSQTEHKRLRQRDMPLPPWGVVYLYSGQKLNYKVWYLNHLRDKLEREHPDKMFVYSKDYINHALPQPTPSDQARIEKKLNRERFLTKEGFMGVKARSPADFIRRADRPSEARIAGTFN
jgi:hypothetical protein